MGVLSNVDKCCVQFELRTHSAMKIGRFAFAMALAKNEPTDSDLVLPTGGTATDDCIEYTLYTCDMENLSTESCATLVQQQVELQFDEFQYSCVVKKGDYGSSAYKTYSGVFNGRNHWFAICGPKENRAPDQTLLDIMCTSAHIDCGDDYSCMRTYIKNIILDGTVEMCRARFNLMVTKDKNEWAASGYDVKNSYDGSYANCIMYCTL